MTITKRGHRGVWLLAFAIGVAACEGRSPTAPTQLRPAAPGAPSVTAISPSTGSTARPTSVTITGTGFLAGATVTVDAGAMSVNVVNSTMITAIVPAHAAGQADVVVTNPGGLGIAVFPVGGTYDDDWWNHTNGATSGTHTLTAPARPGQYEFRYLVDGRFLDVARSRAVTVR